MQQQLRSSALGGVRGHSKDTLPCQQWGQLLAVHLGQLRFSGALHDTLYLQVQRPLLPLALALVAGLAADPVVESRRRPETAGQVQPRPRHRGYRGGQGGRGLGIDLTV